MPVADPEEQRRLNPEPRTPPDVRLFGYAPVEAIATVLAIWVLPVAVAAFVINNEEARVPVALTVVWAVLVCMIGRLLAVRRYRQYLSSERAWAQLRESYEEANAAYKRELEAEDDSA